MTVHKLHRLPTSPFMIWCVLCLACLLTAAPAFARDVYAADPEEAYYGTVYTNPETRYRIILEDDADLLYLSEREDLIEDMKPITKYGNVAFKSLSENPDSARYFCESYYWKAFAHDSGALFLIDMDNREIYIYCDGEIYDTITHKIALTITDNVYRYASDAEYYDCASNAYRQMFAKLSGGRIAQPMKYITNLLIALIISLLVNYVLVKLLSTPRKAADRALLDAAYTRCQITDAQAIFTHQTKVYNPHSDGGGGGSGGSGGSGGGGGGGHSF